MPSEILAILNVVSPFFILIGKSRDWFNESLLSVQKLLLSKLVKSSETDKYLRAVFSKK